MQIDIVAVGRMKAGPEQSLYDRYAERFSRTGKSLHLFGPRLLELPESKARSGSERMRDEAQQILTKVDTQTKLFLLDEGGDDLASHAFAALLRQEQENGTAAIAFVIGGADGHAEEIKQRASKRLRFGAWTWPHQIVRIMLAEQLYRAATILSGHPYHRA